MDFVPDKRQFNLLLKKINKLEDRLHQLHERGTLSGETIDKLYNDTNGAFVTPPKRACLKMSQVLKLHTLRRKGKWTKHDFLLVVEPQSYTKVTKLTPGNFMFDENKLSRKKDVVLNVGYFHSGKSQIAQSGDGGDYGDRWWLANKSLIIWMNKVLKKGEQILKKN